MDATQQTNTAEKKLTMGMLSTDNNTDNSLKKYEDALNDKLLPGKTTHAIINYEPVNK